LVKKAVVGRVLYPEKRYLLRTDGALASVLGVSPQAVSKARQRGRIEVEENGWWDLFRVLGDWRDHTDPLMQRPDRGLPPWLDLLHCPVVSQGMIDELERRALAQGAKVQSPPPTPTPKPTAVSVVDDATAVLVDKFLREAESAYLAREPEDGRRLEQTVFERHSEFGFTGPQVEAAMEALPSSRELLRMAYMVADEVWDMRDHFKSAEDADRYAVELAMSRIVRLARRAGASLPPPP
jgi:hypothetical protein